MRTADVLVATLLATLLAKGQNSGSNDVTFTRDVAPIVFEHCVYCHRDGNIAPFSMTSYEALRPWARAIRQSVLTRSMPPWFADAAPGRFLHDKRLKDADIQTIVNWVNSGAKEGTRGELPPVPQFSDEWQIGTPDLVVTMSEPYKIPATGLVPTVLLPTDYIFPDDTWVQAVEVRPGNRRVVHQALARLGSGGIADGLSLYASGLGVTMYRDGYAKFIPKGTRVRVQMHYNSIGVESVDRTQVGFKFARQAPHTEVRTGAAEANATRAPELLDSHQGASTFPLPSTSARLHTLRLHMSLQGGNAAATLVLPGGSRKVLLTAEGWGDGWEYDYVFAKPEPVPPRSFVEFTAATGVKDKENHVLYFEWTEVNEKNRNDSEPIFTTGKN